MIVNYLTTNTLKYQIAKNYFDKLDDVELVQHSFDAPEVQADTCEEIAQYSAVFGARQIGEPCLKIDVGVFITALGGFPGPYVKYVNQWLDEEHILRLLADKTDRSVYFLDATAIGFPDGTSRVFTKKHYGTIALPGNYQPTNWPTNSLFVPDGYDRPLGMLSDEDQHKYWDSGVLPEVVEYLKGL